MSPTPATGTPRLATAPTASVVRFTDAEQAVTAPVVRRYADPREAVAVREGADLAITDAPPRWPEPTDALELAVSPDRRPLASVEDWLARPDHPSAPLAVEVKLPGGRVRWRPGRAVLEGRGACAEDVVAGVIDFAFHEAELRRLEATLPAYESPAADDVRFAYGIDDADRKHWDRFRRTMEGLARLRLTFARLEPRLDRAPRSLPLAGRRVFARLCTRARVEDRLAAVSDRLEACADLYEGAVDRITDHRWWRKGHRLEGIIVVLLAIESVQLAVELVLRLLQHGAR